MIFKCEGCPQEFKTQSSLLKHISHRKMCLYHYGLGRFEEMKHEAKLESKRKWAETQSAKNKTEYEENKYDPKNPKRQKLTSNPHRYSYVSAEVMKTFEGEAFIKLFQAIFKGKKSQYLQSFTRYIEDKFNDAFTNTALDLAFNESEKLESTFKWQNLDYFYELVYDHPPKILPNLDDLLKSNLGAAIETNFDRNFTKLMQLKVAEWTDRLKLAITKYCYKPIEQYALKNYFGKFEVTTFLQIQDKALDILFSKEIDNIKDEDVEPTNKCNLDEKIELSLEEQFSKILETLVYDCYEPESEMTKNIESRINYRFDNEVEHLKSKLNETE